MTLLELLTLLRKHLKLVIMLPIVCMVAMGLASVLMMNDTYTATTDMYVLASSEGSNSSSALSSDLSASQMLTNDVATLLQSDRVMSDAADQLGLPNLRGYDITVTSESTTRVITLQVTSSDAQGSANVANALADCVSNEVMNVESVNVIDEAPTPEAPSGPNRMLYVAVAAMAGLFAAVAIVVLMDVIDTRVRSAEDVEELLELPVIGRIPEMKGGR